MSDVAETCGISVSYLSDIERGRTEPSLHVLRQLAGALGVQMVEFFDADSHDLTEDEWNLLNHYRQRNWRYVFNIIADLIVGATEQE